MKIDIHTHTKKCKSGDAPTREISPAKFCETILSTDVKIVAITNHNVFDLSQYREIKTRLAADTQAWPGIELDVMEDGVRGHLLVIVAPAQARQFSEAVERITNGFTPDNFTASIEQVLETFDALQPLYVAHYKQKKPNLTDEALGKLISKTKCPSRIIKEVSNSISAGIYISHGHPSIYGSDVHDWSKYVECSRELPDLRLPVDSFEHFCLLLEKDPTTINTVLNRKTSEELTLNPFDDGSSLTIKVFNDINVLFGPKGTGKSCILQAIARYYSENGMDACVYVSASDQLDEIFDTSGKTLTIDLNDYGMHYCTNEIEALRTAKEVNITSLSKYVAYFEAKSTNKNAKKILLKEIEPEEESGSKRAFVDVNKAAKTTGEFLKFINENSSVKGQLNDAEFEELAQLLSKLVAYLGKQEWTSFSEWKEICFLNSAIKLFRTEIERKTGAPAKPTTTGFRDYAMNRINIELNAAKIVTSVSTKIPMKVECLGSLGSSKGLLEFQTEFVFQNGDVTSSALSSLTSVKKKTQKMFMKSVMKILSHACSDELFEHVAELNEIEDVEHIKSVYELLLFNRYFALGGKAYTPSSGEASMVMLQKELGKDKEIYILDEPERSLGNEYISDVIVSLIKERARAGRRVFISTHDANIAVRTLPYSSIYRCHGTLGYGTYVGNPFSNNLVNLENGADQLDWKKVSMRTLEGGEEAFGERGKIYGND